MHNIHYSQISEQSTQVYSSNKKNERGDMECEKTCKENKH